MCYAFAVRCGLIVPGHTTEDPNQPSTPPQLNNYGIQQWLGVKNRYEKTQFLKIVELHPNEYPVEKQEKK